MNNTVEILGTEYHVIEDGTICKEGYDGFCHSFKPIIKVRPTEVLLDDEADDFDKAMLHRQILRHEIIHAFFKESGMERWYENEDLVEWLSIMFPKIHQAFTQAGCSL